MMLVTWVLGLPTFKLFMISVSSASSRRRIKKKKKKVRLMFKCPILEKNNVSTYPVDWWVEELVGQLTIRTKFYDW